MYNLLFNHSAKAEEVSKAVIFWTLDVISGNRSFNSSKNKSALLEVMFPDLDFMKMFTCWATPCNQCNGLDLRRTSEHNQSYNLTH